MEAGYDYLLLRGRLQRKLFKYTGIIIFVFGVMLLAAGGTYYGYATKARADLDRLNVTLPEAGANTGEVRAGASAAGASADDLILSSARSREDGAQSGRGPAKVLPGISATAIRSRGLYPGDALLATAWSNPWSYEPLGFQEQLLLQGFTPIDFDQLRPADGLSPATRLMVPSIGIDSRVKELAILDLGGSRAYETPANAVGHIPETADAGEAESSWFFGHTESPTLGEGSVFLDLRKIPEKLRNGEDVLIITDNGQEQFLYRATSSAVVHQNDMKLYDTGRATIHLVSCVPRLVYDHRLIITGELIAQKRVS